jgi:uncharacterized coiled-coil protein SlyX
MATDQRVRYLEAKVEEQGAAIANLRGLITALDQKIDRRFDSVDRRFEMLDNRLWALIFLMTTGMLALATLILKTA